MLLRWKAVVVKLIPKSAAKSDSSSPGNFQPIALTPAISKLLSSILRDCWVKYMQVNKYLDPNIQKTFLPTVPGVSKHQAKLAAIMKTVKRFNLWLGWTL